MWASAPTQGFEVCVGGDAHIAPLCQGGKKSPGSVGPGERHAKEVSQCHKEICIPYLYYTQLQEYVKHYFRKSPGTEVPGLFLGVVQSELIKGSD